MTRGIYMDNAATTRVDPRVLEVMLPWLTDAYGNPASRGHAFGWEAEEAVEAARREVAALAHADPGGICFTSGATEASNLALRGVVAARRRDVHLVTTLVEHPSVLDTARDLERDGALVTWLPVDRDGTVDPAQVAAALRDETVLVSIIHGNNEVGTVQDLAAIGAFCRARGVWFHTDATQSYGKCPLDVEAMAVDLLSISAHKIHGPKGVGALWVRRRDPRALLSPAITGGGQERGLRSGTLNVPGIVGFGEAARLMRIEGEDEARRIAGLRDALETGIREEVPGVRRHGSAGRRLPGITNLGFDGIEGESLVLGLRGVAASTGSACASASLEPSHVLLALGLGETEARSTLRLSLGRFNTKEEVEQVRAEVARVVRDVRAAGRRE